jgi:hypothetical protein
MSKKLSIDKNQKQNLIWASGHCLCTHLPQNFDTWSKRKLNNFLEKMPGSLWSTGQLRISGNRSTA